ncbi:MAG: hypothetical protein ABSE69_12460, partial [Roseiarcus sp.]
LRVDVEANLGPILRSKHRMQMAGRLGSRSRIEHAPHEELLLLAGIGLPLKGFHVEHFHVLHSRPAGDPGDSGVEPDQRVSGLAKRARSI